MHLHGSHSTTGSVILCLVLEGSPATYTTAWAGDHKLGPPSIPKYPRGCPGAGGRENRSFGDRPGTRAICNLLSVQFIFYINNARASGLQGCRCQPKHPWLDAGCWQCSAWKHAASSNTLIAPYDTLSVEFRHQARSCRTEDHRIYSSNSLVVGSKS